MRHSPPRSVQALEYNNPVFSERDDGSFESLGNRPDVVPMIDRSPHAHIGIPDRIIEPFVESSPGGWRRDCPR